MGVHTRVPWFALALLGCSPEVTPVSLGKATAPPIASDRPIDPLPKLAPLDPARVALGRKLFEDKIMSDDGTLACSGCHPLDRAAVDGAAHPVGVGGPIWLNTPTLFNVRFNDRFNWRGDFPTLEAELDAPIQRRPMKTTWEKTVERLSARADYRQAFALYPDGITKANVKDALATFERSLVTGDSPFDRFLAGDAQAIDEHARRGWDLFRKFGCVSCHQGRNIGGNLIERLGVFTDYLRRRTLPPDEAKRASDAEKAFGDPFSLRVPSLRNVACTKPYFHDGLRPTLEDAVTTMAEVQLGIKLEPADEKDIEAFLRSLTGTWNGRPLCEVAAR